jgi:predicted N-formylglutamate amidohydrolase
MHDKFLLSCEHAGNLLPLSYTALFRGKEEVLQTHRGYDIGALELAQHISASLKVKLHYTEISRLLVEANRSISHIHLFSEFTNMLPAQEKKFILDNYYRPYRSGVEEDLKENIGSGRSTMHLSIHTFTPELKGEKRNADIGLLFDPERQNEVHFCRLLGAEIQKQNPGLILKENYPYLGTDDGFTTYLRSKYSPRYYSGVEIEVNQKFPQNAKGDDWLKLQNIIASALQKIS